LYYFSPEVEEPQEEAKPFISMKMFMKITDTNKLDVTDEKNDDEDYYEYNLINIVSVIRKSDEPGKDNIVCVVKVLDDEKKKRKSTTSNNLSNDWYLFNHFCINQISIEEITHLDLEWKIPSIIVYCRSDLLEKFNESVKVENLINIEVFRDDRSLASRGHQASITFVPLSLDEMPIKGDIVAMDAEFVTLNQEETEIRSDGTRATIKPPQRSVGRITCVRGSGELEGQPFIDDYIATQEQVC
jgi:PAB-dependent poly(A)-specific ribonuclease subunit 2